MKYCKRKSKSSSKTNRLTFIIKSHGLQNSTNDSRRVFPNLRLIIFRFLYSQIILHGSITAIAFKISVEILWYIMWNETDFLKIINLYPDRNWLQSRPFNKASPTKVAGEFIKCRIFDRRSHQAGQGTNINFSGTKRYVRKRWERYLRCRSSESSGQLIKPGTIWKPWT